MTEEDLAIHVAQKQQKKLEPAIVQEFHEAEDDESDASEHEYMMKINRWAIDRSFYHGGYLGFGEGINLDELDYTTNWQFSNFAKSTDQNKQ